MEDLERLHTCDSRPSCTGQHGAMQALLSALVVLLSAGTTGLVVLSSVVAVYMESGMSATG
jgi:hypothetical protein